MEKFGNCYDAALLTDLLKAFDCLPHDLIIAKLHPYYVSMPSLRLMQRHLTDRYHRFKIKFYLIAQLRTQVLKRFKGNFRQKA